MFSIEKTTGKICYSLSARQLSITFGNNPLHWSWRQVQGSRSVHHPNSLIKKCNIYILGYGTITSIDTQK